MTHFVVEGHIWIQTTWIKRAPEREDAETGTDLFVNTSEGTQKLEQICLWTHLRGHRNWNRSVCEHIWGDTETGTDLFVNTSEGTQKLEQICLWTHLRGHRNWNRSVREHIWGDTETGTDLFENTSEWRYKRTWAQWAGKCFKAGTHKLELIYLRTHTDIAIMGRS